MNIKIAAAVVAGLTASFFQSYGLITALVGCVVVLDSVTGVIRSKIQGVISSKTGVKGFWKKIALFCALFFGMFLDCLAPFLVRAGANAELGFGTPFALIIGAYIILNESISIMENLHESGVKLPKSVKKMLKTAEDKIGGEE